MEKPFDLHFVRLLIIEKPLQFESHEYQWRVFDSSSTRVEFPVDCCLARSSSLFNY